MGENSCTPHQFDMELEGKNEMVNNIIFSSTWYLDFNPIVPWNFDS